jgi:hypothetical protein
MNKRFINVSIYLLPCISTWYMTSTISFFHLSSKKEKKKKKEQEKGKRKKGNSKYN